MNQFEEIRDGKVDLEELLKDVVSRKNGQAFLTCVFLFGETGFLSILDEFFIGLDFVSCDISSCMCPASH